MHMLLELFSKQEHFFYKHADFLSAVVILFFFLQFVGFTLSVKKKTFHISFLQNVLIQGSMLVATAAELQALVALLLTSMHW